MALTQIVENSFSEKKPSSLTSILSTAFSNVENKVRHKVRQYIEEKKWNAAESNLEEMLHPLEKLNRGSIKFLLNQTPKELSKRLGKYLNSKTQVWYAPGSDPVLDDIITLAESITFEGNGTYLGTEGQLLRAQLSKVLDALDEMGNRVQYYESIKNTGAIATKDKRFMKFEAQLKSYAHKTKLNEQELISYVANILDDVKAHYAYKVREIFGDDPTQRERIRDFLGSYRSSYEINGTGIRSQEVNPADFLTVVFPAVKEIKNQLMAMYSLGGVPIDNSINNPDIHDKNNGKKPGRVKKAAVVLTLMAAVGILFGCAGGVPQPQEINPDHYAQLMTYASSVGNINTPYTNGEQICNAALIKYKNTFFILTASHCQDLGVSGIFHYGGSVFEGNFDVSNSHGNVATGILYHTGIDEETIIDNNEIKGIDVALSAVTGAYDLNRALPIWDGPLDLSQVKLYTLTFREKEDWLISVLDCSKTNLHYNDPLSNEPQTFAVDGNVFLGVPDRNSMIVCTKNGSPFKNGDSGSLVIAIGPDGKLGVVGVVTQSDGSDGVAMTAPDVFRDYILTAYNDFNTTNLAVTNDLFDYKWESIYSTRIGNELYAWDKGSMDKDGLQIVSARKAGFSLDRLNEVGIDTNLYDNTSNGTKVIILDRDESTGMASRVDEEYITRRIFKGDLEPTSYDYYSGGNAMRIFIDGGFNYQVSGVSYYTDCVQLVIPEGADETMFRQAVLNGGLVQVTFSALEIDNNTNVPIPTYYVQGVVDIEE